MDTFYVVWREGDRNPMVKHPTIDEAEQEAARIAAKELTQVHVLQHVSTCTATVKIEWEYPKTEYCLACGKPDCDGCLPPIKFESIDHVVFKY